MSENMADYKWTPFEVNVLTNLQQGMVSLYKEGQLCDLKVTVGRKTFDCHRLLLAAVSGFFRSLVTSSWRETCTGEARIEHEDVSTESFQMLLDILYQNKDVITRKTAKDVLRMSIFLQVKFLEEHCHEYLTSTMTPEDCVGTWMFAEKYQLPALAEKACAMTSDQIDLVVKNDKVVQLPEAMLLTVLGSQRKLSMDDVCRTILRWVEQSPDVRKCHLNELLPFVSFPQLSPAFIGELLNYYFEHPLREYLARSINDALCCNLVNQKPEVKRQILAQQTRIAPSSLIHECGVIIGGCHGNGRVCEEIFAFRVQAEGNYSRYPLKQPLKPCGVQFVTCVWKNELYLSTDAYFARYKPGFNEWESLPNITYALQKHSMAAVNGNIYVLGGVGMYGEQPSPGIQAYNISEKTWRKLNSQLPLAVQDAATAVLGHRIYVFGGTVADHTRTDCVQCLDSVTRVVYVTGRLPVISGQLTALSDGGTIYLMCDGTKVLKMKENFSLADQKEMQANEDEKADKVDGDVVKVNCENPKDPDALKIFSVIVSFKEMGAFDDAKMVSAVLCDGEMVAYGGRAADGAFLPEARAMSLDTAVVSKKRLAFGSQQDRFHLLILNVLQEFMDDETACGDFQVGDAVCLKQAAPVPPPVASYSDQQLQFYSLAIEDEPYYEYRQQYVQFQMGAVGIVQRLEANGQVTVDFPNYSLYQTESSNLRFAQ